MMPSCSKILVKNYNCNLIASWIVVERKYVEFVTHFIAQDLPKK